MKNDVTLFGNFFGVGDDDDTFVVFVRQLLENIDNFLLHGFIEVAGRLIRENDLDIGGERSGDGHALLLTAGKLGDTAVSFGATDADVVEQVVGDFFLPVR